MRKDRPSPYLSSLMASFTRAPGTILEFHQPGQSLSATTGGPMTSWALSEFSTSTSIPSIVKAGGGYWFLIAMVAIKQLSSETSAVSRVFSRYACLRIHPTTFSLWTLVVLARWSERTGPRSRTKWGLASTISQKKNSFLHSSQLISKWWRLISSYLDSGRLALLR